MSVCRNKRGSQASQVSRSVRLVTATSLCDTTPTCSNSRRNSRIGSSSSIWPRQPICRLSPRIVATRASLTNCPKCRESNRKARSTPSRSLKRPPPSSAKRSPPTPTNVSRQNPPPSPPVTTATATIIPTATPRRRLSREGRAASRGITPSRTANRCEVAVPNRRSR